MKATAKLPPLKEATLKAIQEVCGREPKLAKLTASPDVVFHTKGANVDLFMIALAIKAFKDRLESGFYDQHGGDNEQGDDDENEVGRLHEEHRDAHEQYVWKLAHITSTAIAFCDDAFPEHLARVIRFVSDPSNLRRYAVLQAAATPWGEPKWTKDEIKLRMEAFGHKDVADKTVEDDLKAMGIDFEKLSRGRPGKGGKDQEVS